VRPAGAPATSLPYDAAAAPSGPTRSAEWGAADELLRRLSGYGVPAADEFVMQHRTLKFGDVQKFFASIAPDPMLAATDNSRRQREALGLPAALPSSLGAALEEIAALPDDHVSQQLRALATYVHGALRLEGTRGAPQLPPWANRSRILKGQRAFMTRLIPGVLALVCKSLPEAYSAARPASVLNLSGELAQLPYHRLLGTLQLLVTVSTPYSFEGPWYPALVAAQEMQLLHAGVRMNVAPRLVQEKRGRVERTDTGWTGADDYVLWGGYDAFRAGWPVRRDASEPAADPPQVVVSQTDMLATIIAFSLLVVDGVEALGTPLTEDDAEAYWHLWRVFAVLKGMHPPGKPDDGSWVPETLADARAFWQSYRRHYLAGPTQWTEETPRASREQNPSGYALTSAHLRMLARLVRVELPWLPVWESAWLRVMRFYVWRMSGEDGAARVGVPPARFGWLIGGLLGAVPRWWAWFWQRIDTDVHVAISRRFLASLIDQVYGARVVFPIPQTAQDLREFVQHGDGRHKEAAALQGM
jgi:hypothetical protein